MGRLPEENQLNVGVIQQSIPKANVLFLTFEPRHDKTSKMSVHPAKTIRLGIPRIPRLIWQWRLRSAWADAHTHFVGFVMLRLVFLYPSIPHFLANTFWRYRVLYALCKALNTASQLVKNCHWIIVIMPPTSKKLTGHIGFGLSVRPSVCPFVTLLMQLIRDDEYVTWLTFEQIPKEFV